ncbi:MULTISPECIES: GAF domain-containing protein [unclassified Halomonas]|uniref:GAF domain-containing protein n=1 Tax=unclassified Halomonas TaxID=2609666 RepID=UPI0007DA0B74|nr:MULTISPECIES: GAF domain-containing protein [unclassified Halomonas]MBT2788683.1 GAF domain-containing protein [Halomonas sp. ISL-106]MBT2798274.1 GAF domain-containing protein [Halomonas sp. ISL-104]OAL60820.1 histidine kinase [Halomonas sp. ALS9]
MQNSVDYPLLNRQLEALLDTRDWLTNSAQTCAFIYQQLSNLNWVGFYLQRQPKVLGLGPFQGQPACHPIPFSKGVCGAAARLQTTQRVDDVHAVADHIACDANSRSELVVPIVVDGLLWGVLDLDSPMHARFTQQDQAGVEALVATFMRQTELPDLIEPAAT